MESWVWENKFNYFSFLEVDHVDEFEDFEVLDTSFVIRMRIKIIKYNEQRWNRFHNYWSTVDQSEMGFIIYENKSR